MSVSDTSILKDMRRPLTKSPAGTCTLAIVMMEYFPYGSLPGQDPFSQHVYADTDLASFQDLWLAGDYIEICCLQSQHMPGWSLVGEAFPAAFLGGSKADCAIGRHESIGVFVWTRKSPQDREVPQGPPTDSLPSNFTILLNSVNETPED